MALIKKLQMIMEKFEYSQSSFARQMKINKSTLHNYLNGTIPSGLLVLIRISKHFNISLDELVFEKTQSSEVFRLDGEQRFEVTGKKL
ncbi:MAG: helix-turn-helix transcriptional regulator [Bdellovibrionales bacterium]|nr:helix-turn-helix transcriptional regulator [Bdellovibrionales bacterium]